MLPSAFRVTRPLGRMVILVILPLAKLILSHASGGNCRALEEVNLRWSALSVV